jgi:hypothetical protein
VRSGIVKSKCLSEAWSHLMRSAISVRPRGPDRRRFARAGTATGRDRPAEPFAGARPRCLGELRLVDLLRAGMISHAEFEAERASLLARL